MKITSAITICTTSVFLACMDVNMNTSKTNAEIESFVQSVIMGMNDRQKVGQLVMASTLREGSEAGEGDDARPTDKENQLNHMQQMINDYHAGAVIIYDQTGAKEMAEFNKQLQRWAGDNTPAIPLFISADLEYGAAQRVPEESTIFPRQMGIGATGNPDHAGTLARITALEGKAMGYNWSFSPDTDVNSNPLNPVIGVRSFGEDVQMVSDMVAAMVIASQENKVVATPKHFPGHGNTEFDSHYDLSTVRYERDVLDNTHLPPFQAAIDAGAASIMTAHVIIEAIDSENPATLSEKVLTGLLRGEMGFDGIIVTDAMSMDAIRRNWGAGGAAVKAINAGADIIMATGSAREQTETFESLYKAIQSGEISQERVNESLERILRTKVQFGLFEDPAIDVEEAVALAGNPDHRKAAADIAEKSITLVKNEAILPYDPTTDETTLLAGVTYINEISKAMEAQSHGDVISWQAETLDPTDKEIQHAVMLAGDADRAMVFTYTASKLTEGQSKLVHALLDTGIPVVAISLGLPFDIREYPEVDAYIASYALDTWYTETPIPPVWEASVDVIFGAEPTGKLPVNIEELYLIGHGLGYENLP